MSVLNLTDKGIHLSPESVIGTVNSVDKYVVDEGCRETRTNVDLPPHLQKLVDNCSTELTPDQRNSIS